jgi:hypothetical protein
MKQQQSQKLPGKKLSGNDMKNLKGGFIYGGTWVCTSDDYQCFWYQWQCQRACSDPRSCQIYPYCP